MPEPSPAKPDDEPHQGSPSAAGERTPRWTSDQLLGSAKEAHIEHGGEMYRLIRTRNGKLILVK